MLYENKALYLELVQEKDLKDILEIYNSNDDFLLSHMATDRVTDAWLLGELQSMESVGFSCLKAVEASEGRIIGIVDLKAADEAYLSLMMLHREYRGRGIGGLLYQNVEEYIKIQRSSAIRIDVVTEGNASVMDFWLKQGFHKQEEIELNWTGKPLAAVVMKKVL